VSVCRLLSDIFLLVNLYRYRFTATYIKFALENGFRSPHRLLDAYVHQYTQYLPSDGSKILRDQEAVLPSDSLRKLESLSVVFNYQQLAKRESFPLLVEVYHTF
jgi:hypothetical protein